MMASLPPEATGSPRPGRKEGLAPGNTLKHPCLFVLLATKRLTFLRDPRARMDWQMSWVFLGPRRNSFIRYFFHSFISKSLSSGVWSQFDPVTICLNNLKTAWVRTASTLSVPKQLTAWPTVEPVQVLHFHTCTIRNFPNVANPPVFKSNCIPVALEILGSFQSGTTCSSVSPLLPNVNILQSLA